MRKSSLLVVFILFSVLFSSIVVSVSDSGTVLGNEFSLKYSAIDNRITTEDSAEFSFEVENNGLSTRNFRVSYIGTKWDILTDPLTFTGVNIAPKSKQILKVFLNPTSDIVIGQYLVNLQVGFDNDVKDLVLPIYVEPLNDNNKKYQPSLSIDLDVPKEVDPQKGFVVTAIIDNLNKLDLELRGEVSGNLFHADAVTKIQGLEKGVVMKIPVLIDKFAPPQTEKIIISFYSGGEVVKTFYEDVGIVNPEGSFSRQEEVINSFLKTTKKIVFTNEGNSQRTEYGRIDPGFLGRIFTITDPKAEVIDFNGKSQLAWKLTLDPGQKSQAIMVTTTYRPLALFLIAVLVYIYYRFFFRKVVIIRKKAINLTKGPGLDLIKIIVEVRNPTSSPLSEVTVIDHVPHIARIEEDYSVGSLRPTKLLKHEKTGNLAVRWDIVGLDPFEHRIFTYKIKPKLSVVGSLSLPRAEVKYIKNSRKYKVRSNSTDVS